MTHQQLVASNKVKSWVVVIGFTAFVTAVLYCCNYLTNFGASLPVLVLVSSIGSIISYWNSDKLVLAMSGAKPADRKTYFDFYTTAENVALKAGIPTPKLYVISDPAMNAFATGRDPRNAAVAATTGLLSKMNRAEIEGVVAHEITHITNYDTRLMTVVGIMVGAVMIAANAFTHGALMGRRDNDRQGAGPLAIIGVLLMILSPIAAQLIQLAISRRREFGADAGAVAITRNPQGMINALEKLGGNHTHQQFASPGTAHLFITDPFKSNLSAKEAGGFLQNLFATHPPLKERIAVLQKLL